MNVIFDVGAILIAIASILASYVAYKKVKAEKNKLTAEYGKTDAEAADVITDSAIKLYKQLEERLENQDTKLEDQDEKIRSLILDVAFARQDRDEFIRRVEKAEATTKYLWDGINILIEQLQRLGCEPNWKPDQKVLDFLQIKKE